MSIGHTEAGMQLVWLQLRLVTKALQANIQAAYSIERCGCLDDQLTVPMKAE